VEDLQYSSRKWTEVAYTRSG